MIDAAAIRELGLLLYGEHWQQPMADDLGVSTRTLRHWLSPTGGKEIPPGAIVDLVRVADARFKKLGDWLARKAGHVDR